MASCDISPIEDYCYRDLERWLADKKKRERRADKHGAFNLESKGKHIKPEAGSSDGMIVNKDYIFTENYSDEEARFADIDGKVYYEGAMTWGNHKQAQEVIDHESNY